MEQTDILKKPRLTEKVLKAPRKTTGDKQRYTFIVDTNANKIQIAAAIKEMYKVEVDKINTLNQKGKAKVRQTKGKIMAGFKPSFKKAIVILKKGEIIDLYE